MMFLAHAGIEFPEGFIRSEYRRLRRCLLPLALHPALYASAALLRPTCPAPCAMMDGGAACCSLQLPRPLAPADALCCRRAHRPPAGNQMGWLKQNVKWGTDYLLACHNTAWTYVGAIGAPGERC